eukprot:901218-Lingulodinium_polyedra.AAC.1
MDKSHVNGKLLISHAPLLKALRGIQANMSFAPVMLKTVLMNIASERKGDWKFTMNDIECFSTEVGKSIRTMCRHCAQGLRKTPMPRWVATVFDLEVAPQAVESDLSTQLEATIAMPDGPLEQQ